MNKLSLKVPGGYEINPVANMPSGGLIRIEEIIRWLVTSLLIVATLLALFFLIYGGIKWITSGGDKNGIQSARQIIIYALIGLIITFLAFAIIRIIGNFFGLQLLPPIGIGGGTNGGIGR